MGSDAASSGGKSQSESDWKLTTRATPAITVAIRRSHSLDEIERKRSSTYRNVGINVEPPNKPL